MSIVPVRGTVTALTEAAWLLRRRLETLAKSRRRRTAVMTLGDIQLMPSVNADPFFASSNHYWPDPELT